MALTGECATSGDIQTTLSYALPNPNGTRLYAKQSQLGSTTFQTNYIMDDRKVVVHDLRGREDCFSLDTNGFEFVNHETTEKFLEKASIEKNYYTEMEQLIKERTGAHKVQIITHRIRQSYETLYPTDANEVREHLPSHCVHAERTPESVIEDVKEHLGRDGEALLLGRVRFFTVWRPIGEEVHHEPLAVADWQTSSDVSRLLPMRLDMPPAHFEVFLARYSSKHSWYYLRHQAQDEAMLMKCYDSHPDGTATFCLHSSFRDLGCHKNAPRRRSIEVNALAFG